MLVSFNIKHDYSSNAKLQYINCEYKLNTLLIPEYMIDDINIFPGNYIPLVQNNKNIKPYSCIDYGSIIINNQKFYYCYIAPGLNFDNYYINYKSTKIKIDNFLSFNNNPKLINGLIVLPENLIYYFKHSSEAILRIGNLEYIFKVNGVSNKYNYFSPNNINTILKILDTSNLEVISAINNAKDNYLIKPIQLLSYPMGSISLDIIHEFGVKDLILKINDKIYRVGRKINIQYLKAGKYSISLLDDSYNPITIKSLNNKDFNTNIFEINIENKNRIEFLDHNKINFDQISLSNNNKATLIVNIVPYDSGFRITNKNGYDMTYDTGYQVLNNLGCGEYSIEYNNKNKTISVLPNIINHFSDVEYKR